MSCLAAVNPRGTEVRCHWDLFEFWIVIFAELGSACNRKCCSLEHGISSQRYRRNITGHVYIGLP